MAVVTRVSPEVEALLRSKGYQQAPWDNNAWYDPNDPNGNYLTDQSLAALTGASSPVPGAVLDRETGTWTLNGQPVSMTNAQGQVWINNETPGSKGGQLTGTGYWATPTPGGGGFLNSVLGGIADLGSSIASPVADLGPVAPLAIIGGGLAANSGLLGGASAGASAPASAASVAAPATTSGVITTGPFAGATAAELAAANGMITTGPFAGATAAELAAANAGTGALTGAGAATAGGSTLAKSLIPGISNGQLLTGGLNIAGGLAQGQAASNAAQIQADAQIRAAQIAAEAAKFKPVGVTTGFGSSKFGFDANGNLTSAGYELTPEMKAQRDALIAQSTGLLGQFQGAQAATAPMGAAAQRAMQLGQGYLTGSPQEQAAKYLAEQQGLLAPSRANAMAQLQAEMQAQGRGGFAIGGGVQGQGAANPQLQALLNAQMQQDAQLAADATKGGMDYARFGAGMVGTGGDLLSSMYGTQVNAFNPYKTALGGATAVENLGQDALNKGISLGSTATAASAMAGQRLGQGISDAAATMAPANAYSPWANFLGGSANLLSQYKFGQ